MASNINPNNIDGSYPVAGQDNNSQGFRDNFTNIKVNFQYAEQEINDLETNVLLKAALTGTTLDNNMNNNTIYAVNLNDVSTTRVAATATSGSVALNYASGQYQTVAPTANISLAFSNWPAAGYYGSLRVQNTIANVLAAPQMTLPAAVSVGVTGIQGYDSGNNAIVFSANGTYTFDFASYDGGSTITITDLSRPLTNFNTVSATGNVIGGNVLTAGQVSATGNITGGNVRVITSTGAIGYATGAGNTVTQATSKTTGVTINAPSGRITANAAALNSDTTVSFTMTNSSVAASDVLILNHVSGGTAGSYTLNAQPAGGSASINIRNVSAGSLSEAIVIGYAVIKGATS